MPSEMDLEGLLARQRAYFVSGKTCPVSFRRRQLERLSALLQGWEPQLLSALSEDLGKAPFESYATEIGLLQGEIRTALRSLRSWTAPQRVPGPILQFPSKGWRYPEPKGCVLIVSPWNYPVQLTLAPLISAIAAGCCAILSLPPDAPRTSAVLAKMLQEGYPQEYIAARMGNIPANTVLFSLPFDHIFFTGSPRVGKIVLAAAAENLTPVTLELGGKSPCIVMADADIRLAARRIVWGKCLNAGQTCVAPDYVLVQKEGKDALVRAMALEFHRMYPGGIAANPDYPRIVNEKHFTRLRGLMEGEKLLFGGFCDPDSGKIELTALDSPGPDSPAMREEIFGPILPVIAVADFEEAARFVSARPKPLACYLFTGSIRWGRKAMQRLSYGGGCLNDTVVHLTSPLLPFGGVGNSGMGACHGKAGFDTFTHWKSVLERSPRIDLPVRYPPYGERFSLLKKLMR